MTPRSRRAAIWAWTFVCASSLAGTVIAVTLGDWLRAVTALTAAVASLSTIYALRLAGIYRATAETLADRYRPHLN